MDHNAPINPKKISADKRLDNLKRGAFTILQANSGDQSHALLGDASLVANLAARCPVRVT